MIRNLLTKRRLMAPAAVLAALGIMVPAATTQAQGSPIQHVVVIYLENHSFDNVLGYWCNANPGRCPDGGMPASVTLSDGTVVTPSVTPDLVPRLDHTVAGQLAAMNIVKNVPQMNGWQNLSVRNGGCGAAQNYACISGYQPASVPNETALANQFAISDMTFSLADSPSWGGHLYTAMASLDGFTGDNPAVKLGAAGWGCDSNGTAPWRGPMGGIRWIPSCIPDYSLNPAQYPNGGAFQPTPAAYHASIFDELDAAGLSWKIYGTAAPVAGKWGSGGYIWSICPSLAECLNTSQKTNLADTSQLFTDAAAGTLPAYSVVTAGGTVGGLAASCHNSYSMAACDNYIGQLVSAVGNSPDWSSTAVFITFDDFGGFYDQVPPGLNPDFTRQGPRSPLIIVSPYAKPAFTDTSPATFAGILAYTEQNFGLSPMGPNDNYAYDFSNAFDYTQVPLKPARMVDRPLPASARHIHLTPALLNDPS